MPKTLRQVLKKDPYAVLIPIPALEGKKTALYQFNGGRVFISPAMNQLIKDPVEKERMLDAILVDSAN